MLKRFFLYILLVSNVFAGTINVAVAANVSYAINDLIKEFHKIYPDIDVQVTLGSTGKLTAQIKNGAPFDIFMAADISFPQALYKDGYTITRPAVYAQGSLAYLSRKKEDFSKGIEILKSKKIKHIAIANAKTAPYGKAAVQALKNAGLYEELKPKFVYSESISQTVTYALRVADIGLVAKSALYSSRMKRYKQGINWADVDIRLYNPINQGMVILRRADGDSDASVFYTFMLSLRAKKVLNRYGYLVP